MLYPWPKHLLRRQLEGVGRNYQRTFVDTCSSAMSDKLYTSSSQLESNLRSKIVKV